MPSVPQIIRMRHRRGSKYDNTPALRGSMGLALIISLATVFILFGSTFLYTTVTRDLPSLETFPLLLAPPDGLLLQPTRFYDRSGVHVIHTVENPTIPERQYLPLGSGDEDPDTTPFLPDNLVMATIAIADPEFWSHPGFSMQGIYEDSHNTLAQKLVSDLLLWDETPGVWRALRERILAAQITHLYGREKVLEWYLNNVNYGKLAFGAEAAAQVYLGKTAAQLNLAEAAILAGVAESPALNPIDSPQTAIERSKVVIDAMLGQGLITADQAAEARDSVLNFQEPAPSQNVLAPAFINLVWEYLTQNIPVERLERGGFEIITTLDYDLQIQATCTTRIQLSRILGRDGNPPMENPDACPAAQLLPTLILDESAQLDDLAANLIVLDPKTGQILAAVSESPSETITPAMTSHQPGSLLTPFVYLTAFTRGFSPASLLWDIPLDLPDDSAGTTDSGRPFQGPVRLREALANDYLNPAIQVIQQIGGENVLQTSRQIGLPSLSLEAGAQSSDGCIGCSLVSKGGVIPLIELVQAFGMFNNQGILVGQSSQVSVGNELEALTPVMTLSVQDPIQQAWFADSTVQTRPVISPQLAYLVTDMLSDEAARWPSLGHPNPLEIGRPAGAKMGTTTSGADIWTVGFTPQRVVGVWMGHPETESSGKLPPKVAAGLWHAVIQYAVQGFSTETWPIPPGVTTLDVCDPSGMLPTLQCQTVVSEVFLAGQEPTQPDTLYQAYQINRETGRLATVFTPPELIEERIYLNIPPEASAWAESINLEKTPETYDVIYAPAKLTDALIQSPGMFETLNGVVTVRGRAGGPNFSSYRLQAGEGLNPSGWFVVQGDTATPVDDGILGTWDTSGLNGLYALQLIVLRENQQVDTTTIQVTVDNLPPEVEIPYPGDSSIFSATQDKSITFLVKASDNLGLAAVEFYLDGRLVITQTHPPFAPPWESSPGEHTLTVKAIDLAGNSTQVSTHFTFQ